MWFHGHVGGDGRPRVRAVMDMGMKLAMVKVWRLYSGPMGMWVVMAGQIGRASCRERV